MIEKWKWTTLLHTAITAAIFLHFCAFVKLQIKVCFKRMLMFGTRSQKSILVDSTYHKHTLHHFFVDLRLGVTLSQTCDLFTVEVWLLKYLTLWHTHQFNIWTKAIDKLYMKLYRTILLYTDDHIIIQVVYCILANTYWPYK